MSPTFGKNLLTLWKGRGQKKNEHEHGEALFKAVFGGKTNKLQFFESYTKADKVMPKLVILFGFRGLFYNHVSAEELTFVAFLETRWAPSPIISEITTV